MRDGARKEFRHLTKYNHDQKGKRQHWSHTNKQQLRKAAKAAQ
jgi:hypothetical protein